MQSTDVGFDKIHFLLSRSHLRKGFIFGGLPGPFGISSKLRSSRVILMWLPKVGLVTFLLVEEYLKLDFVGLN